jgi:mono/diheme cytochrome c family protein
MKKTSLLAFMVLGALISSCGGNYEKNNNTSATAEPASADVATYDPKRGEGKWTAENVNVGEKLDETKAESGQNIANTKCLSCHKLSEEKLVGPGWSGVTKRRTPEWIMNFITNPDAMLDKDAEAQAMLEICLVRMPNQNLSDQEARNIVEFMRKNDGVK